jgi:hypothetical protein
MLRIPPTDPASRTAQAVACHDTSAIGSSVYPGLKNAFPAVAIVARMASGTGVKISSSVRSHQLGAAIDRLSERVMLASEIELAALRSQFVATSEEIAKDLALLAGRIDEEPTDVQGLQLAAAKEIAAAQERLRLEADRLEGPTEQRVTLMRAMLEAQKAAQQQLAVIFKRHRPSTLLRANLDERLANMARQLEASAAVRLAEAEPVQLPTNVRGTGGQATPASIADEPQSGNRHSRSDPSTANRDRSEAKRPMSLAVIIKAGTSLALALALVSAALVLLFF